jgi:hypothetical protein
VLYQQKADKDETVFKLGRMGGGDLSSCEDAFIMSGAFSLGLANAYNPDLVLYHHIDVKRFKLKYLVRLMHAYGASNALLASLSLPVPGSCSSRESFLMQLRKLLAAAKQSLPFGIGMAAYYLGARSERRRQHKHKKPL